MATDFGVLQKGEELKRYGNKVRERSEKRCLAGLFEQVGLSQNTPYKIVIGQEQHTLEDVTYFYDTDERHNQVKKQLILELKNIKKNIEWIGEVYFNEKTNKLTSYVENITFVKASVECPALTYKLRVNSTVLTLYLLTGYTLKPFKDKDAEPIDNNEDEDVIEDYEKTDENYRIELEEENNVDLTSSEIEYMLTHSRDQIANDKTSNLRKKIFVINSNGDIVSKVPLSKHSNIELLKARNKKNAETYRLSKVKDITEDDGPRVKLSTQMGFYFHNSEGKARYIEYINSCESFGINPYPLIFASLDPGETGLMLSHRKPKIKRTKEQLLEIFNYKTREDWEYHIAEELQKLKAAKKTPTRRKRNKTPEQELRSLLRKQQIELNNYYAKIKKSELNSKLQARARDYNNIIGYQKNLELTPWGTRSKLKINYLLPDHVDIKTPTITEFNTNKSANIIHAYFNEIFAIEDTQTLSKMPYSDDFYEEAAIELQTTESVPTLKTITWEIKDVPFLDVAEGIPSYPKRKKTKSIKGNVKERKYDAVQGVELSPVKLTKLWIKTKIDSVEPCYAAATYFQLLVSSTPMDEKYTYKYRIFKHKALQKKDLYTGKMGTDSFKLKSESEIMLETKPIEIIKTKQHFPDKNNVMVRGDWIITFRGLNFKAFESGRDQYTRSAKVDYVLDKSYFEIPGDPASIEAIARILFEKAGGKDAENKSLEWNTFNINPRWEILEKGGYLNPTLDENGNPGFRSGPKYKHGATIEGFSYQAPNGFKKLVDSYYEASVKANKGYVTRFIKQCINPGEFDVSNLKSKFINYVLKKYPELNQRSSKYISDEIERIMR